MDDVVMELEGVTGALEQVEPVGEWKRAPRIV